MVSGTFAASGYLPVSIVTLQADVPLPFDIYVRQHDDGPYLLFRERSRPLSVRDCESVKARKRSLYILMSDAAEYRAYLKQTMFSETEGFSADRYCAVREAAKTLLYEATRNPNLEALVDATAEVSRELVNTMCDQEVLLSELFQIIEHDYYTFTHICNVSSYCLILAKQAGFSDRESLERIAHGAMLHDLGKRMVPASILNKPGRLNADEWQIIKKHPAEGLRQVIGRKDLTWGQLMMVYQHHERMDGTGYPLGIGGDEIHPWARLCAVTDVFDALTSNRPYRQPMPLVEALEYLQKNTGSFFDVEMVRCWTAQTLATL